MSFSSIGDMRQHFFTTRHNAILKTNLQTLTQELSTGQASDLTAHLGADQTRLSSIDRHLQMLGGFAQSNRQTGQLLDMMQLALSGIEDHRAGAAGALLTITDGSSPAQIEDAAAVAKAGFEAVVQAMNTRFGDLAMFGGNDTSTNPLAPAEDMLDALRIAVGGATGAGGVEAALEDWFNTAGGGFDTSGFQGDTGAPLQRAADDTQTVDIKARADDPAIRDALKYFAMGALAADPAAPLSKEDRTTLQQAAGEGLMTVSSQITSVQSSLGSVQGLIEQGSARLAAKTSSLGIARNDLVLVDPFETATKLQNVQLQLETHYTLTARLSRLSLTEYLR